MAALFYEFILGVACRRVSIDVGSFFVASLVFCSFRAFSFSLALSPAVAAANFLL